MKTELSKLRAITMPSGSVSFSRSASSRAPAATSTVFAVDCLMMPSPTIGTPLPLNMLRSSTVPRSTRATSPSRTRYPSSPSAITSAENSSGVLKVRSIRTVKVRFSDSRLPAGASIFSLRNACSISATVRLRAAKALRSIQTRRA